MKSDDATALALIVSGALMATGGCAYDCGRDSGKAAAAAEGQTRIENDKCALQGGELFRGQMGEFVCVKPGSVKWRRWNQ
jgi:hypothetical protein